MNGILSLFFFGIIVAASAEHSHGDVGEYGNYNTWRKAVCEKNDEEMLKEMDVCFLLEHKNVQDASEECAKEASPESEGKIIPFVNAACKDPSVFIKFDKCFEEYEANSAFRDQMEITPEISDCYSKILKKYALEFLEDYLKQPQDAE